MNTAEEYTKFLRINTFFIGMLMDNQSIFFCLLQLEVLPTKDRTMAINMALGDLYKEEGMDRSAITSYKEVLR